MTARWAGRWAGWRAGCARWWFPAFLGAGLVLRLVILTGRGGGMDADEAVGLLMARRVAVHGELSIFYWGQNYGGVPMTWIEGAIVRVVGFHIWVFRSMAIAMSLVNVLLVRALGRRLISRRAGDLAAVLLWVAPYPAIAYGNKEYLFYTPGVGAALAASCCWLRWYDAPVRRRRDLVAGGVLAGLSFWLLPLMLSLVIPPLVAVVVVARRLARDLACLAGGLVLGASPWVVAQLLHSFAGLQRHIATTASTAEQLRSAVGEVLPAFLIAEHPPQAWLGVVVLAAAVVWVIRCARRRDWRLLLLGAAIVIWPVWLTVLALDLGAASARYALPVLPPLMLMAAWVLDRLRPTAGWVVAIAALLAAPVQFGSRLAEGPEDCPADLRAVIGELHARGTSAVTAVYWVAAPLGVCSGGSIRAAEIVPVRDVHAAAAVRSQPVTTVIVTTGGPVDLELVASASTRPPARRDVLGSLTIWTFEGIVANRDLPQATL